MIRAKVLLVGDTANEENKIAVTLLKDFWDIYTLDISAGFPYHVVTADRIIMVLHTFTPRLIQPFLVEECKVVSHLTLVSKSKTARTWYMEQIQVDRMNNKKSPPEIIPNWNVFFTKHFGWTKASFPSI